MCRPAYERSGVLFEQNITGFDNHFSLQVRLVTLLVLFGHSSLQPFLPILPPSQPIKAQAPSILSSLPICYTGYCYATDAPSRAGPT